MVEVTNGGGKAPYPLSKLVGNQRFQPLKVLRECSRRRNRNFSTFFFSLGVLSVQNIFYL